ncbi:ribosome assembly cofactor RimP [Olivibacter sitiensis]|uniref:ribosome assembly cofactor RimP n=1 Tax=Olivibacter sitiensis TaxID=376470 RepID=UPI0004830781|nr:ribosome assembly cofactor RimP [Olivibacter sitiensis]
MKVEDRVRELVEEKISDRPDLFLVSISLQKNGRLAICVDGDEGINIQDCAAISRHVGYHLEEEALIEQAYNLEVSSPGIDSPLLLHRQYVKNTGRTIALKTKEGERIEGVLLEVTPDKIVLETSVKEKGKKAYAKQVSKAIDEIAEIKVIISFK